MQITLTNLGTVTPDEAEETLQTVTDFLKGLNLEKLITLLLLLAGCLVVMKLVLRLTDRAFLRLELERSLHTFIHAALRVILWMITLCIVLDYVGVPMTQPGGGAQRHWTGGVSGHPGHSVQPGRRHPGAALQPSRRGLTWRPAASPVR